VPVPSPPYLTAIKSEFNGPNNLKAYRRNGPHVPTNQWNMNISTTESGLAVSQFSGARKDIPIQLFDVNIYKHEAWAGNHGHAAAIVRMDGKIEAGTNVSLHTIETFCSLNPIPSGTIEVNGPTNNGITNPGWRDLNSPIQILREGSGKHGAKLVLVTWQFRVKNNISIHCTVSCNIYVGYGTNIP